MISCFGIFVLHFYSIPALAQDYNVGFCNAVKDAQIQAIGERKDAGQPTSEILIFTENHFALLRNVRLDKVENILEFDVFSRNTRTEIFNSEADQTSTFEDMICFNTSICNVMYRQTQGPVQVKVFGVSTGQSVVNIINRFQDRPERVVADLASRPEVSAFDKVYISGGNISGLLAYVGTSSSARRYFNINNESLSALVTGLYQDCRVEAASSVVNSAGESDMIEVVNDGFRIRPMIPREEVSSCSNKAQYLYSGSSSELFGCPPDPCAGATMDEVVPFADGTKAVVFGNWYYVTHEGIRINERRRQWQKVGFGPLSWQKGSRIGTHIDAAYLDRGNSKTYIFFRNTVISMTQLAQFTTTVTENMIGFFGINMEPNERLTAAFWNAHSNRLILISKRKLWEVESASALEARNGSANGTSIQYKSTEAFLKSSLEITAVDHDDTGKVYTFLSHDVHFTHAATTLVDGFTFPPSMPLSNRRKIYLCITTVGNLSYHMIRIIALSLLILLLIAMLVTIAAFLAVYKKKPGDKEKSRGHSAVSKAASSRASGRASTRSNARSSAASSASTSEIASSASSASRA